MSLITSCPACSTRFKIVPDQLKISDGWVRCGQCAEIFDASTRIEPDPLLKPRHQLFPVLTETAQPSGPTPVESPSIPGNSPADPRTGATEAAPSPTPTPTEEDSAEASRSGIVTDIPPDWFAHPDAKTTVEASPGEWAPLPDVEPEFVKAAKRRERWTRPWVRVVLSLLCLLCVGALGAQVLVHQRDRVAAQRPDWVPAIQGLCTWLDCEIGPLKDTDSVVIDATRFTKLASLNGQDVFQLEVTLKNKAAHAVASPALELTLTNTQDEAVVRKVFMAKNYLPAPELAAQAERPVTLSLKVTSDTPGKISGYRIALFHP